MVPKAVQEAGYTAVGMGVLALRQVQTRRREISARVGTELSAAGRTATGVLSGVRTMTAPLAERLGDLSLPDLPGPLASALEGGRTRFRQAVVFNRN